jgi:hypothetical protein
MKTLVYILSCLIFSAAYGQGIKAVVLDAENRHPLAARIVITDDTGRVYNSYYSKLKGFFTEENGAFFQDLNNGNYSIEVFHGIDYLSEKFSVKIDNNLLDTVIALKPWHPLKKEGWYNGDGHDHLYTDLKPDTAMMKLVRKICVAQGVDFMFTAQGWSGYNDSTWKEGYDKFSDEKFHVSYGSEMPKYRTGHTWWIGQQTTHGLFEFTMDTTYENQYYQSDKGTDWNFRQLPFPQVPDVEVVKRFKKTDGSLAIAAHPTSWWMQKRGEIEKYVTNVACNLSFGLLSGKVWDGVVAMGYDHDHYFYQNLWFNILNQDYRMPAFSELDGGLGKDDKFYYGSMRTYFHIEGDFQFDKIVAAAKKGSSFLTSGPIVIADIDKKYNIGDIVPVNNTNHVLHINAYASGERDDYLSYVVVFRNGRIFKLWDIRYEKTRKFSDSISISEKERSWYIVKVYGRKAWSDPKYLDIMAVCEKRIVGESVSGELDVAFTNPFYFRNSNDKDPGILQSKLHLNLSPAKAGTIEILDGGKKIKTINVRAGKADFVMPVNGLLKIIVKGYPVLYRSLYIDYLPHRNLIEKLASGKWKNDYSAAFNPGEVPWSAFNFDKTKSILSQVNWEIELVENERDKLYPMIFED